MFSLNKLWAIKDRYVDFDIIDLQTGYAIETFSMSQKENDSDFFINLKKNLSEVMGWKIKNIKLTSKSSTVTICQYTHPMTNIINTYAIEKIPVQIVESMSSDIEDLPIEEDEENPYDNGSWGDGEWHCIRCGWLLVPILKDDKNWGHAWQTMLVHGTKWYLCSNEQCFCHHDSPLILFHPVRGWTSPAGDSYAIGWVK